MKLKSTSNNYRLDKDTLSSCHTRGEFDILKFWQSAETKKQFPRLCKLALGILSIPASSSPGERAFSLAGNVVTKKRTQLGSGTVDSLVVMNSFYRRKDSQDTA